MFNVGLTLKHRLIGIYYCLLTFVTSIFVLNPYLLFMTTGGRSKKNAEENASDDETDSQSVASHASDKSFMSAPPEDGQFFISNVTVP